MMGVLRVMIGLPLVALAAVIFIPAIVAAGFGAVILGLAKAVIHG